MRHFVSFHQTSTLANKLMVFTDMQRHQVQDAMVQFYGKSWHKIYSEQEASQVLHHLYHNKDNWVRLGEPCEYNDGKEVYTYPNKYEPEHKVSLESITSWFRTAKPTISSANLSTQIGAHIEEFIEMLEALNEPVPQQLISLKEKYYQGTDLNINEVALLDSLSDQVVTATGVAYFSEFKWDAALTEVNQSNFSKFEDGKVLLNENGKIMKGKNYFAPNLEKFV